MPERWQMAGFALYIHWPFCLSKCPYCDFNSHVSQDIDPAVWEQCYLSELRRHADETQGRILGSIFFGGGTPSLMPPSLVAAIIDEATRLWTPANDIEITLEANPSTVEVGRFTGFRTAGVSRVSVGVQALNDADLRRLGRLHDTASAISAIKISQAVFDRTSFDLIYARQAQSLQDWRQELSLALALAGDHLSLYQLTIEPDTVFGARHARGLLQDLPDEDLSAEMYLATQDICEAANLPAYEVSNHAKGAELSRHNMVYWRCGDYIGIGPGAHGRLTTVEGTRLATACPRAPNQWLTSVQKTGQGEDARDILTPEDQASELLVMGLRLSAGLDLDLYKTATGLSLDPNRVMELVDLGLAEVNGPQLRTTLQGRMVLNSVIRHLGA